MSASAPEEPVVGRADELLRLDELAARVAEGSGGAIALTGEAGIGKTRLVRAVPRLAAAHGVGTTVGRCVPGAMAAYRPLREAVLSWDRMRGFPTDGAGRARLAGLRPLLEPPGADGLEPTSPEVVAEATLRLLGDPASPGLLVLEDLHWADAESLAVVEYLADHVAESACALVITLRPGELGPADELVRRLHRRGAVTTLRLAPLDRDAATALVHERLGAVTPAVSELLHRRSGGNPLLLGELLDELALLPPDERVVAAGSTLPVSVRESVRAKLGALPPHEAEVLQAAALVGLDDLALLAVAAATGEADARTALADGRAHGLLEPDPMRAGPLQFRHELVREAVRASTPADLWAAAARRALDQILPEDIATSDDEALLEHLALLSPPAGAWDVAARATLRAAVLSFDRWALASAERWLSRARSHAGTDADLVNAIDLVQLRVSASTGHGSQVRRVGQALLTRLPPDDAASRLEVLLRLAQVAGDVGEAAEARQLLADARPLLSVVDDRCSYTKHRLATAVAALAAGEPELASRLALEARDLARSEPDERDLECSALAVIGQARWPDVPAALEAWQEGVDLATASGMPLWRGRLRVCCARAAVADLTGDDLLHEVHAAARDAGAPVLDAQASALEAELALLRGQPDVADRHLREASAQLVEATPPQELAAATYAALNLQRVLDGGVVQGPPAAVALQDLLAGREPTPFDQGWTTIEGALGDLVRLDPRSPVGRGVVRDAIAAVARQAGHTDGVRALREAVDTLAPTPWLGALLVLRAAPSLLADGPSADLRELLREAIEVLDDLPGARGAADLGRDLIRRAGAPYPRRTSAQAGVPERLRRRGITAREWQVLALVGEGLTNRQIAARLFLSPRTVEKHVERMLTKTGAGNRAGLATLAAAEDVT